MVLDAWRTRAGGAFRSNPLPAPSPFDRRPARPRVDGLLLASRSSFRSPVWGGDGVPVLPTPTGDPTSSSAAAAILPPEPGHSPTLSLARRSKPASDSGTRGLTGAMGPSLVLAAGGAPGVHSLRRFDPAGGWACISASPGPHAVRAHRPPRFIFVGVTGRLLEVRQDLKSGRPGTIWLRLLGFDSRLRSDSVARRAADRSCLGLCLLQGCGHGSVHPRGLDPSADHQPPGRLRRQRCRFAVPYPLVGFGRPSRSVMHSAMCSSDHL
jgi:hypothetical protein